MIDGHDAQRVGEEEKVEAGSGRGTEDDWNKSRDGWLVTFDTAAGGPFAVCAFCLPTDPLRLEKVVFLSACSTGEAGGGGRTATMKRKWQAAAERGVTTLDVQVLLGLIAARFEQT